MYRNALCSGVALAVLTLAAAPVYAQQAPNASALELETINVAGDVGAGEAARSTERAVVAPLQATVLTDRVTRQELDAQQITDVRDIERLSPGVSFNETSRSFNVRGLDRNRVLTTIDGIPLPWLEDGARGVAGGVSTIDFDSLSAVDIVKGADSSIFGSGSLGGVVAFRTLEPEDLIEPGANAGGLTKSTYDSRDRSIGVEQAIAGRVDNTFVLFQGGYRTGHETDNKGGDDVYGILRSDENPSDYDRTNLLAKLNQHFDGGHVLGFTAERYSREEDIEARDSNINMIPGLARYVLGTARREDAIKRERLSVDYSYDGGGWADAAQAVLFWQRQELRDDFQGERASSPAGFFRRDNTRDQTLYGINGSVLKILQTGDVEHGVTVGGQLYGSKASQFSAGEDNCGPGPFPTMPWLPGYGCNFLHTNQSDMPDVDGVAAAVFVQDEMHLLDDKVRLTPGLRFDWYRETPQETSEYEENPIFAALGYPEESKDSALSPKLRGEFDVTPEVTAFAQWARGFRAPNATELYLTYGAPGTYLNIGNPDLEPETSNGFDVGILAGDKQAGGSVKGFYNHYENFIDTERAVGADVAALGYDPGDFPQGVTRYINRANVEIYGVELEAHYEHGSGWHTFGQFGAYVGRDTDLDLHLNSIPAAKAIVGVGYAQEDWGADLIFTAAAERDEDDVENALSATPSYQLLDFIAWWSPEQVEGLTLRAGVYNIFDETYYPDALDLTGGGGPTPAKPKEFYTEPGRNARVSAIYKF